ncbi:MAG TPA: PAS domain S-box protein [Steroidobacteraceae bacterium]
MDRTDTAQWIDPRQLLEAMTDGLVVHNASGEILGWNASALRILGRSEEDLRKRTVADPDWRSIRQDGSPFPIEQSPVMHALRTRRPKRNVTMGVQRPDGSIAWICVDSQPLIGRDGELYGVVSTFRDLAQRRRAEERLVRAIGELADLYNNAPCGYHSLDRNGVFVRINDTELRWLGYTREELIGRRITEILTPTSARKFEQSFPRFLRDGRIEGVEAQFVTKSGATLDALINSTVVRDANGEFLMSRSTVFDNTHRKVAERQMRRLNQLLEQRVEERTAALHEALQELEAFTSSVSHDLRAPVRTIDAFARMLSEDVTSTLSAEGRQFLERIVSANRRQAQLIGDLLNLSHVFTAALTYSEVDLSALAHSVIEDLRDASPKARVEVRIAPGLLARADEGLVRSVMDNLLGNAWKFTNRTEHPRIEVGSERQDREIVYFVRDNGVGFDPAQAGDLFKPFRRMHADSDFPGTGIGLATVARIVKRHRGRIWIESAPGEGTTVFFTLGPATPAT